MIRDGQEKVSMTLPVDGPMSGWDPDAQRFVSGAGYRANNEILDKYSVAAAEALHEDALNPGSLMSVKNRVLQKMGLQECEDNSGLFRMYFQQWATTSTVSRTANRQTLYSYRLLKEFANGRKLRFGDMTYALMEEYIQWMATVKNLSVNTRGCHVKNVKTAMSDAYKKGLHQNMDFLRYRREKEEVDNVYLTDAEIRCLEEMDLCGMKEVSRDLFLIGCYTAMRFSDYSRLSMDDIRDGVIRQVQQKTMERVVVPANPKVIAILQKYGGKAPRISQQKLNSNIKVICRDAGITDRISIVRNGQMLEVEKWELVSSHTARRTAATNMFKAGIPAIAIMKITGHRTESSFMKYIKIDKEENAEMLKNSSFFK